jgi:hypothetical protein
VRPGNVPTIAAAATGARSSRSRQNEEFKLECGIRVVIRCDLAEERAHVVDQQLRLLERREVTAFASGSSARGLASRDKLRGDR